MKHEYLAVALGPGADPERRNLEGGGDRHRDLLRNALEDDGEGPGIGRGAGVGHEPFAVPLHPVAAKLVDGLRPQSDMPHHGDAGGSDAGDDVSLSGRSLELHPLAAGLFENPGAGLDSRADAEMLVREGEVDDDQRMGTGSDHDLAVVDHLIEGGWDRRIAAGHDHRHTVTNENAVDAGAIDELGGRPIVGGDHGEGPVVPLRGRKVEDGDTAGGVGHGVRLGWGEVEGPVKSMVGGCSRAV